MDEKPFWWPAQQSNYSVQIFSTKLVLIYIQKERNNFFTCISDIIVGKYAKEKGQKI